MQQDDCRLGQSPAELPTVRPDSADLEPDLPGLGLFRQIALPAPVTRRSTPLAHIEDIRAQGPGRTPVPR